MSSRVDPLPPFGTDSSSGPSYFSYGASSSSSHGTISRPLPFSAGSYNGGLIAPTPQAQLAAVAANYSRFGGAAKQIVNPVRTHKQTSKQTIDTDGSMRASRSDVNETCSHRRELVRSLFPLLWCLDLLAFYSIRLLAFEQFLHSFEIEYTPVRAGCDSLAFAVAAESALHQSER